MKRRRLALLLHRTNSHRLWWASSVRGQLRSGARCDEGAEASRAFKRRPAAAVRFSDFSPFGVWQACLNNRRLAMGSFNYCHSVFLSPIANAGRLRRCPHCRDCEAKGLFSSAGQAYADSAPRARRPEQLRPAPPLRGSVATAEVVPPRWSVGRSGVTHMGRQWRINEDNGPFTWPRQDVSVGARRVRPELTGVHSMDCALRRWPSSPRR